MAGRDPVETEFTFTYDEEGRLALCEATAGGSTVTTEYLYNEDGWISSVRSGNMETTYTWETVEDGLLKGTASNTDLNIFPDSTELYIPADEFDADGNLTCAYRYAVQPSAFSLIPTYIKHQTYWNYETVTIFEEAAE